MQIYAEVAELKAMTQLYNRRFLKLKLPRLVSEAHQKGSSLSAIMLDIDYFKNYNDHYGHQMGDEVIKQIASALLHVLRGKQDYAFRYGGEEFLLLLPDTGAEAALRVAERITQSINRLAIPHAFNAAGDCITVSQGVWSSVPGGVGEKYEGAYIVNADKALYFAKEHGRNRYEFFDGEE